MRTALILLVMTAEAYARGRGGGGHGSTDGWAMLVGLAALPLLYLLFRYVLPVVQMVGVVVTLAATALVPFLFVFDMVSRYGGDRGLGAFVATGAASVVGGAVYLFFHKEPLTLAQRIERERKAIEERRASLKQQHERWKIERERMYEEKLKRHRNAQVRETLLLDRESMRRWAEKHEAELDKMYDEAQIRLSQTELTSR